MVKGSGQSGVKMVLEWCVRGFWLRAQQVRLLQRNGIPESGVPAKILPVKGG